MIKSFLEFIVSKIPLSSNILAFNSYPDYTDNAYAMFLYLHKKYGKKYKYVWLMNDEKIEEAKKVSDNKGTQISLNLKDVKERATLAAKQLANILNNKYGAIKYVKGKLVVNNSTAENIKELGNILRFYRDYGYSITI